MSWGISTSNGGGGWDRNIDGKFQVVEPTGNNFGYPSGGGDHRNDFGVGDVSAGSLAGGDEGTKRRGCFNCGQEG